MRRMIENHRMNPYISFVDLENEEIVIKNPRKTLINIGSYVILDYAERHHFEFPDDYEIRPYDSVTIYCCPGKYMPEDPSEPHLLWMTAEGRPRKAEVLRNDPGDSVILKNSKDKIVSKVKLIMNENKMTELVETNSYGITLNTILMILYVKIGLIFSMYYSIAIKHYQPYVLLWWLVYLSDILITECRRQGTVDILTTTLSRAGDHMVSILTYTNMLLSLERNSWTILYMILFALEMLSEQMYFQRIQIAAYRDTIDTWLDTMTLLPKLIWHGANLTMLLEFDNLYGVHLLENLFVLHSFVMIIKVFMRIAFFLKYFAIILQLIDATYSISKLS